MVISRILSPILFAHVLNACEHVTLHAKRDFVAGIKLAKQATLK